MITAEVLLKRAVIGMNSIFILISVISTAYLFYDKSLTVFHKFLIFICSVYFITMLYQGLKLLWMDIKQTTEDTKNGIQPE